VPTNVGAPPPPVTRAGIQRLIDRLAQDKDAVEASKASPQLKEDTKNQIFDLIRDSEPKGLLVTALDDFPNVDWVPIATAFRDLTPNLLAATDQGACRYQSGNPPTPQCIMTTRTQCEDLGGSFSPGENCP
jgi:hypothetical protein